ncbi:MAG TPA: hypothetical protein VFW87_19065 [Pirellulales bacterium]|nr:hypothetical protein [Pirellulales bacterium]
MSNVGSATAHVCRSGAASRPRSAAARSRASVAASWSRRASGGHIDASQIAAKFIKQFNTIPATPVTINPFPARDTRRISGAGCGRSVTGDILNGLDSSSSGAM